MALERIIIGSKNSAKVNEWRKFFDEFGLDVGALWNFSFIPEPIESAATFIENARIKASWYAKHTGVFVFADDGGYEIDYLGGWPGVKSRRILLGDREASDEEMISIVLERMNGVPFEKRTVRLTFAGVLSDPTGKIIFEDVAGSSGYITENTGPVFIVGYPFRSIHFLPELGKTYAELTEEELVLYSHKRPIAKKLAEFFR